MVNSQWHIRKTQHALEKFLFTQTGTKIKLCLCVLGIKMLCMEPLLEKQEDSQGVG
jgi:hypothetical protein